MTEELPPLLRPGVRRLFLWVGVTFLAVGSGILTYNLASDSHSMTLVRTGVFWGVIGVVYLTLWLLGSRASRRR